MLIKSIIYYDYVGLLARRAKLFVFIQALIFLGALFALPQLKTHYSMTQFLPKKHALLELNAGVESEFQLNALEPLMVVLKLGEREQGTWLEGARVVQLRELSSQLETTTGVEKVIQVATVEGASQTSEGITVGKLLELTPENQWRQRVLKDALLTPQLISSDGRQILFVIFTQDMSSSESAQLIASARASFTKQFPSSGVFMAGVPAVQSEIASILGKELGNFMLLGLVLSFLTLASFFKGLRSVLIPMIILIHANVVALGWMALTGTSFTVLSTTLPVLVTMTVISMATHTMLRFASDWKISDKRNKIAVLCQSFRVLFFANSLTALTTSIGFFAISFANVPLIKQYGLSVGCAILISWLSIIFLLPSLLALFPVPEARAWTDRPARWSLWIRPYRKEICWGVGVAALLLIWQGTKMNWQAQLFDDLPANHEARASTQLIDQQFGGMIPFSVVIRSKEDNAWNDPESLQKLAHLLEMWRADPRVGSAVGLPDFLAATARIRNEGLPTSRRVIAEDIFLYSFSEKNPLNQYLTPDGKSTRLQVRLRDIPAGDMANFVASSQAEVRKLFPGYEVAGASMATTVHVLNEELSHELIYGFWQALALISVLMLVVFRSVRYTLVAVLPNLLPPILLMGALGISGTPIKPGIALIFSIALGIAFDNTVYLLGRLRYLAQNSFGTNMPQIQKAWYQEANLCFFSTVALSAGFSVFLVSYFSLNQAFGAYMLVSLLGGLVGDLILLPAMIQLKPSFFKMNVKIARKTKPELSLIVTESKEEKPMQQAVAAAIAAFILLQPGSAYAADKTMSADDILKEAGKKVEAKAESATIKMTIIEANGGKKERALNIKRKGGDNKQQVLVRMLSPPDLKGTGLLSVSSGSTKDQWLYMPSSKQTRRILGSQKSSNFMDSELNYEDMGTTSDLKFDSKVLKTEKIDGHDYYVIESVHKAGDSSYGKVLTWIDKDKYLVGKAEYYDKKGKLLKTSQLSAYKQYGQIWRAQKVQIKNVQNKRATILDLSDLKIGGDGLSDDDFSQSALTDAED